MSNCIIKLCLHSMLIACHAVIFLLSYSNFSLSPIEFLANFAHSLDLYLNPNKIPGPVGRPLTGHLHLVNQREPYVTFKDWAEKYGPIYQIRLGFTRVVILSDQSYIREVFSHPSSTGKPPLFLTTGIMEGCGIVAVDNVLWKWQRKVLFNCFWKYFNKYTNDQGDMYVEEVIFEQVNHILGVFSSKEEAAFDANVPIWHGISNMIAQILFGRTFFTFDDEFYFQKEMCNAGSSFVHMFHAINYFPVLRYLNYFSASYTRAKLAKKLHHEFLNEILEDYLNDRNANFSILLLLIEEIRHERHSLKDMNKQVLHVLADLFGVATKTIRLTVMWALLYFMANPHKQKKAQDEMDSVIGRNRNPTTNNMLEMPYMKSCLMEVQRLANVTPMGLPHWTNDEINSRQYTIPKNTMIIALLYAVHMDESNWRDSNVFRPERFLSVYRTDTIDSECFMPYLVGQRACNGVMLAEWSLF